ncbi:hypothetical protein ACY2DA_01575 [Staphylococcus simulans]
MEEENFVKQTNTIAAMVLGIIGSIFGIFGGFIAIMFAGVFKVFADEGSGFTFVLGIVLISICIVTLVVSCIINKNRVLMGVLLVLGGILNFIFMGLLGLLSGTLILIAGILTLSRK